MRTLVIWSTVLVLATAVNAGAAEPKLETEEQKTLYALGLTINRSLSPFNLSASELELVEAGLDFSSGEAHGPVRAQVTITFGGPRRGHLLAREWCGKLIVVDIGLPPADPSWPVLVTDQPSLLAKPQIESTEVYQVIRRLVL